ncbi:MAG: metalloregulator ArsR/SmtB family transcription factor [Candidatus Nanopelagicales bacterium]|nr:metalloregulator ArsR/SmtB family transcription factor [Candidatus Nanopelagicales bacterium]
MTILEQTGKAPARDVRANSAAVSLFRSLGDPARLAIVQDLADNGPMRVTDLVSQLGLAQSTVSAHLACLRECGLVDAQPMGRASVYSLTRPELPALLKAAEQLLAATGYAVDLCGTSGSDARGR